MDLVSRTILRGFVLFGFVTVIVSPPVVRASMQNAPSAKITEAQCGTLDFSSRFVPPKDQGNAGFCYSFTASDLISEAVGLQPPTTASAFYAASQYIALSPTEVDAANSAIVFEHPPSVPSTQSAGQNSFGYLAGGMGAMAGFPANPQIAFDFHTYNVYGKPLLAREGGSTDLLIAHLLNNKKICTESEIPSQLMLRRSTNPEQQNFFAIRLGELGGGEELNKAFPNRHARKPAVTSVDGICLPEDLVTRSRNQIGKINSHIQDWAAMKLRHEAEKRCQHPVNTDGVQVHMESFRRGGLTSITPSAPADRMMELLQNGRPFGLHYDVCLIAKCDADYQAQGKGWHASVVVGRQWNPDTKSCQLKIKNSWGEGCTFAKNPKLCKDGYYYLDADTFASSDSQVIWINKK